MHTKSFNVKFEDRRDLNPDLIDLERQMSLEVDMVYGLFINLFNSFCNYGGLIAVLDILSPEKLATKSGISSEGIITPCHIKLPLVFIQILISPFKSIKQIAKDELIAELVCAGEKAFFKRLEDLDEKEIKDINRDNILNAVNSLKGFLKLFYSEEEAEKIVISRELGFFLKFIESPFLEKRLNGLSEIRRMIDKAEPYLEQKHYKLTRQSTSLTSDDLLSWMMQNNILEKILNENAHAELIKRTSPILIFLAKKDKLTKEIIELLWKSQQDKHEDIIRVVYEIIINIIDYLSIDVSISK